MATAPTEDEKKRKAASFGDAAAAAQAPGTTQMETSPRRGYLSNPPAPPAPKFSTNVRVLSGGGAAPAVGSLPLTGSLMQGSAEPQATAAQAVAPQAAVQQPDGLKNAFQNFMPGTRAVLSGAGDDISGALKNGQLGSAIGQTARATAALVPALTSDLVVPYVKGLASIGGTFATGNNEPFSFPSAPASAANQPVAASDQSSAKPNVPAVNAPGQAATTAATTATASAAPPAQAPGTISFDKATNTYSGQNIGADAQIVGGRGLGAISAQNNAAAEALSSKYRGGLGLASMQQPTQDQPQPGLGMNFGSASSANSWQARNDLRNLEVSASSITDKGPRGQLGPAKQAYLTALGADQQARTGSDPGTVARTQAGAQMFGAAQAADAQRGATAAGLTQFGQRNKIDQARLGLDTQAMGFQAAGQKALADAQAGVLAAKTPQEQEAARQKLASIMGKGEPNYSNRFVKLAGGESDPDKMGVTRKLPDQVFDAATGSMVSGGQAAKAPSYAEGTRIPHADGSVWIVKGGQLVREK